MSGRCCLVGKMAEVSMLCSSCDLFDGCMTNCIQGDGPTKCDILVVTDFPNKTDDAQGIPMSGSTGTGVAIRSYMHDYFPGKSVRYTTSIRCRPPYGVTPKKKNIDACKKHLLAEVEQCKPTSILLLGSTALLQVMGVKGVASYSGQVFTDIAGFEGINIVATYHPYAFMKVKGDASERIKKSFRGALHALSILMAGGGDYIVDGVTATMLNSISEVEEFVHYVYEQAVLGDATCLSYDIEGSSLSPWDLPTKHWPYGPCVLSLGFALDEYNGYCIPYKHPETPFSKAELAQLQHKIIPKLWDICCRYGLPINAHNWKYDALYSLVLEGWDLRKLKNDDPMHMHTLLFGNARHGLKELDEFHGMGNYDAQLKLYIAKHKEANPQTGRKKYDRGSYGNIPLTPLLGPYNAYDAVACHRARNKLYPMLHERNILYPYHKDGQMRMVSLEFPYKRILRRVSKALITMEISGLGLDQEYHDKVLADYQQRFVDAVADIRSHPVVRRYEEHTLHDGLNILSSKQLAGLFFDAMRLPDASGSRSIAKNWLITLSDKSKLVAKIAQARKLATTISKSLEPLSTEWLGSDSLLHTNINVHIARTGRTSSSDPNHQNLPRDKEIKRQFIPTRKRGNGAKSFFVNLDYSQLELRVIADVARERKWLEAFANDVDIHTFTAMDNYGIPLADITDEVRTGVKSVNFGVNYKMGAKKLMETLNNSPVYRNLKKKITIRQAGDMIRVFFEKQKQIAKYHKWAERFVHRHGYIPCLYHRKREWDYAKGMDPRSKDAFAIQREAVNTPIQNGGSEQMLLAIARIFEMLFSDGLLDSMMNLTVHDSLLLEVMPYELFVPYFVKEIMEHPLPEEIPFGHWDVKLKVDAQAGYNYADMVPLDEFMLSEFGYVFSW